MATYTREGRFTPVNINSDPSATLAYNQQRLALQAKGTAIVESQYQKLLDLELTHGDNQEKLNGFFKDANEKLNSNVNVDLSDYNNVQQALNIFEPLSKSPEYESIRLDNQYTKHYKGEIGKAEYYKNKQDKDGTIGSAYSDYNYKELVDNYTKFKTSSGQDPQSWGDQYTYKPYYDYTEEQRKLKNDFLKQPDKWSTETMDANGVVNRIVYEGKSADQLQKYLDLNLSAKAKEQMLLEGRVEADMKFGGLDGDQKYTNLLKNEYTTSIKNIDHELTTLDVLKTDKTNKKYTPEELKQRSTFLKEEREKYNLNLQKLDNPEELKSILKDKKGNFANYYLNNKVANFSLTSANNRVSNELDSNSAFVQALNRRARLNEFVTEIALRQNEFAIETQLEREKMANSWQIALLNNGLDAKGNPLGAKGLGGDNKTLVTENLTDANQQSTRELQEKELEGGVTQVMQNASPFVKDAFGEVGENPFEISKNYLKEMVNLSNKLQAGDKQTLELLRAAPDKLSKQDRAKQNILTILDQNDDKILAYTAYNKQKKETLENAKQQVIKELKASGVTVNQINEKLNSWENINRVIFNELPNNFNSLEQAAEFLVKDPELAEKFKGKMTDNLANVGGFLTKAGIVIGGLPTIAPGAAEVGGTTAYKILSDKFEKIKNIGTEAQLQINKNLNNSYFTTQSAIDYRKPLDTETPASKAAISRFNASLNGLLPYLPETDGDFDPTMVTGYRTDTKGVTITYQPSEISDGKLVLKSESPKTIRIDNSLVALNVDDKRDKILLGTMTLGNGETPVIRSKGLVPFKYTISTASGNRYSSEGDGQGGFVGRVLVGNTSFMLPDVYGRPSDIEKKMNEMSSVVTGLLIKDLNYDLTKANKAPLTKSQQEAYVQTPEFMESFNNKIKDYFESGKIFNTFGASNPGNNEFQNTYLQYINNQ